MYMCLRQMWVRHAGQPSSENNKKASRLPDYPDFDNVSFIFVFLFLFLEIIYFHFGPSKISYTTHLVKDVLWMRGKLEDNLRLVHEIVCISWVIIKFL